MTPAQYCEEKTRGSGSSFFYAFIFLEEDQRRAMMALYAFCREVDDVADEISEQSIAIEQIAFWREEIHQLFHGKHDSRITNPRVENLINSDAIAGDSRLGLGDSESHDLPSRTDQSPLHPVTQELGWAKEHFSLDEELFIEILDGMLMDINGEPIIKASDLSLYCYRVAGVVGLLSIEIFGYKTRGARNFATSLGEALQLTNILRDLKDDAEIGRIYLPQEDRLAFRVANRDFEDGGTGNGMKELLQRYGNKAEKAYQQAIEQLPAEDRASLRPSLLMAAIYFAQFKRLKACGFNPWNHTIKLSPLHKIWIAWRVWRYEKKAVKSSNPPPVRLDF